MFGSFLSLYCKDSWKSNRWKVGHMQASDNDVDGTKLSQGLQVFLYVEAYSHLKMSETFVYANFNYVITYNFEMSLFLL